MCRSDARLKGWFRDYNRLYFRSRLPHDVIVVWSSAAFSGMGETDITGHRFIVQISCHLKRWKRHARFTLLHEMVHIKRWHDADTHGEGFQKEMKRLAQQDAFKFLW